MQKLFSQNILQSSEPCNNFWTWIGYLTPDQYFGTMYIAKSLPTHATDGLYWEEECLFLTCLFKLFDRIDNPHSEHFTIGKLLPFIFLRDCSSFSTEIDCGFCSAVSSWFSLSASAAIFFFILNEGLFSVCCLMFMVSLSSSLTSVFLTPTISLRIFYFAHAMIDALRRYLFAWHTFCKRDDEND